MKRPAEDQRVTIEERDGETQITIAGPRGPDAVLNWIGAGAGVIALALVGCGLAADSAQELTDSAFQGWLGVAFYLWGMWRWLAGLLGFFAFVAISLFAWIRLFRGDELITLTSSGIIVHYRSFGLRREYPWEEVSELRVDTYEHETRRPTVGRGSIAFAHKTGLTRFGRALAEDDAERIVGVIRKRAPAPPVAS